MNNTVISCEALSRFYNDGVSIIEVLKGVNLEVQSGEMVAIVGSSGSGKSTLLHLLGGLDHPSEGRVSIAGRELAALNENDRSKLRNQYLGFVYQFHHLLPEFTALENAAMPLLIGNQPPSLAKEKAEHLLELVGLKDRLTHKIGELSGGERQRVAIARALVSNPLCVLADEPTGNLDPKNAEKVLELFFDLQRQHQTSVVMVTHDMTIAKKAQRVLQLSNGCLLTV